ncbi:MAG: hypothetical protein AAF938_15755 [Myxococcota bacterium]
MMDDATDTTMDQEVDAPAPDNANIGDANAEFGVDEGSSDASLTDGGNEVNPDVELTREITFEQPDGTNGWEDSSSVIFNWRTASIGRDRVPDARVRMATSINVPTVVNDVTYRGDRAVRLVMEGWSSPQSFRQDLELIGNTSNGVDRRFRQGETHVVGFAMRIEHATWPGEGFQLYHQYHNPGPPKEGYGSTLNPAVSLVRTSNTDLSVILRDNRPGGERLNTTHRIEGGVRAGLWVRWVFKTRFANFDSGENGLVEVWSAEGREPLTMHFRVNDRPVGYAYEDDRDFEVVIFDMYGRPFQEDATVYIDEIRVADGDLDPSVVDPIRWTNYQHPLNHPHNDDLR